MIKRTASAASAILVLCALAGSCLGEAEGVPSASSAEASPGSFRPAIAPGPSTLVPSPCVVGALRVLHPYRLQMIAGRLKLTDEQRTKVSDILAKSEEVLKLLILNQRKAAEECVAALTRPSLKESEVVRAAELAAKAEGALLAEKIKTLFAVRAVLNADQVKQLNSMIDETTIHWCGTMAASGPPVAPPGDSPAPAPTPPE